MSQKISVSMIDAGFDASGKHVDTAITVTDSTGASTTIACMNLGGPTQVQCTLDATLGPITVVEVDPATVQAAQHNEVKPAVKPANAVVL